ncbi:MAG: cytochrome c-type biogenesis protein CcmH [Roseibaca calidilacus]|uniref:Cytochrome c-type biogenesis protein n=1 Tax=Roseibaca calidilacus TaxID=1666912 RepID=A0A0P7YR88_9RHOB|nr:cytochrome c-type biogenesis protein [Roseibaca calidilacus]KPP91652.1 MAG: cytochrome c-type biogenesis protein CcmH [Roseibaca calidilacus]CUX82749.1 cytochrome c-type biogenesis protein CcmH [Roseibaca calidilacus]
MRAFHGLALALTLALSGPALAVQPDEILDDPVLEERARDLSTGLRCLVCRNESIDESNADLARDMRILVRERLVAGDSDSEVVDFLVARYGEYVLLRPTTEGSNALLWLAAPALFLVGFGGAVFYLRSRARQKPQADDLSDSEKQRLAELLKD